MIKIEVVNNEKYKVTLGGSPLDMLSELSAIIDSMLDYAAKDGEKELCFMADMIGIQTNKLIERRFHDAGNESTDGEDAGDAEGRGCCEGCYGSFDGGCE